MRMSPSASPAGLPDGSAKRAMTLSPRCSKLVRRWPVTTASRAQPLVDRREQDLVQLAPRNRNLRPAIAGGAAARLGPDQLAVLVVEGELLGEDAGRGELVAETERGQLADGVGLQVDAVAERAQHRHRVIDAAGDADLMQAQRLRQPGNSAADDDDVHCCGLSVRLDAGVANDLAEALVIGADLLAEFRAVEIGRRSARSWRSAP